MKFVKNALVCSIGSLGAIRPLGGECVDGQAISALRSMTLVLLSSTKPVVFVVS